MSLLAKKLIVSAEYSNFANVFLKKLDIELSKYSNINKHFINLELNKQPLYSQIYSLESVKLETLKTYIKTNLVNSFIWLFKSSCKVPILFIQKLDNNLCLNVNYQGLNSLIIKNQYLLPLIC